MKKSIKVLSIFISCVLCASLLMGCDADSDNKDGSAETVTVLGNFTDSIRVSEPKTKTQHAIEAWYSLLEEKNGVKLDIESPPNSNYTERLQIMLASGQYPDLIAFPDAGDATFTSAAKEGKIIPLNQYLDDAENIKKYTLASSWDALKPMGDEKIYAIPRSSVMRADGFWVRADWLKNVGLTIPENGVVTLAEFTEILKRFTEDDPDGNGEDDTYGLEFYLNDEGFLEPSVLFPFNVLGFQHHEGEYACMDEKYCLEHDNYEDALSYSAMLFENGWLDPACFTVKSAAAVDRFYTGKVGVITGFSLHTPSALKTMRYYNPDAEITYITAISGEDGSTKGTMDGNGIYWAWGISSQAENPEKIVKMLDWILSDEGWETSKYGLEGYNYTINENGEKEYVTTDDGRRISVSTGTLFLRRADDTDIYISHGDDGKITPPAETCRNWLEICMENYVPKLGSGFVPDVSGTEEFSEADKELSVTIAKIISGELPVSEYKNRLRSWYASGGEEYIREMSAHIEKTSK